MRATCFRRTLSVVGWGVALLALGRAAAADPVMMTERWANNDRGFAQCERRIQAGYPRNLLARDGAQCVQDGGLDPESLRVLTDGAAGKRGGEGRAVVDGQPTVLTYYLGEPRVITEVGMFTFNGDARANQDFEVRFAHGGKGPGQPPEFSHVHATTGYKVRGANGGGFHTAFFDHQGGPLVPFKADWVQFRIWRTYNLRAGQPGKTDRASGWCAVIELEVLGTEGDIVAEAKKGDQAPTLSPKLARRGKVERMPRKPVYRKQDTWQATMLASREAQIERDAELRKLAKAGKAMAGMKPRLGPWFRIGPFSAKGKRGFGVQFPPEKEVDLEKSYDGKSWRPATELTDGAVRQLRIPNNAAEYFYRTITAGRATLLPAWFGSDDGLAVWLNGQPVLSKDVRRGVSPNQDHAKLALKPGTNHLLCKVYNNGGGSGFYFSTKPKPSGGKGLPADNAIWSLVERDFTSPEARRQMDWERADGIWAQDWTPGDLAALAERYVRHVPLPKFRQQAQELAQQVKDPASLDQVRQVYYRAKEVREVMERAKGFQFEPLRRAIRDLGDSFPEQYPQADRTLARLDALEKTLKDATEKGESDAVVRASQDLLSLREEALLANPLLDFARLLLVQRKTGHRNLGLPQNWQGNCALPRSGYEDALCSLAPVRPDGKLATLYKPEKGNFLGDVELHFDADRLMFSSLDENRRWAVYELKLDPKTGTADPASLRRISPADEPDVDWYDPCYLPDGRILLCGTACFHGVPCVGGGNTVANTFLLDPQAGTLRQLTFDQDHNWCPTVLANGRVLFSRWEYSDSPHYFTRLLFHMNPDGTEQMEYYGSNSFWPNSIFYARPVPGHPTQVTAVISGHHGVPRMGELVLLDPAQGRHEAAGAVQRVPGHGQDVEPIIRDALVNSSWPRFLHPWPLSEKYFLVSCQPTNNDPWGIYLVDVFDNMLLLAEAPGLALFEPVPLRKRPTPPVVPDKVDPAKDTATVYLNDVYFGPGLAGVPRGTVKALRIYEYHYAYPRMGGHIHIGVDGPWDVHRIHGTVKVEDDGSALFAVPANVPLAVQPLDAQGKAIQVMRSWLTAMPGEVLSCAGCHERQNTVPTNHRPTALTKPPQSIQPWRGPARGFSFLREVQPVLDKHCVGCHNGTEREDGKSLPNFADTGRGWRGFVKSYLALHPYVRRPGPESDYHLQVPCEWHADTSELVQKLEKGHHGVQLDEAAWDRLLTWIDLNVPCHGTWSEHRKIAGNFHQRRLECRTQYANRPEDPEAYPGPPPERPDFVKPGPEPKPPAPPKLDGWPFDPAQAKARQANAGLPPEMKVELAEGVALDLVLIPAGTFLMGDVAGRPDEWPVAAVDIPKPFYLGRLEVTNAQFACFNPDHDSAYISVFNKDHGNRGRPANRPHQPVIRVSWQQAQAFCYWLSKKTGRTFALPTEAQWEWACRAGATTPMNYGALDADFAKLANLADKRVNDLTIRDSPDWIPSVPTVNDGACITDRPERWQPNPWGLYSMHGNVAEWTRTTYKPYPYDPADGRDRAAPDGEKVVRGGSFYDRPKRARCAFRLAYPSWRRVFNVGFRVLCEVDAKTVARK